MINDSTIQPSLNKSTLPTIVKGKPMKNLIFVLFLCFAASSSVLAVEPSEEINAAAQRILPQVIEWRRHLHQYPELGNREFKTADYIEKHLRRLGLEVRTKVAKTGVVGILKGGRPGATIGLRADMDGLPVTERVNLPFASKEKGEYNGQPVGVMHACGHDTHVAMLLGTAEVLSSMKAKVPGTVVLDRKSTRLNSSHSQISYAVFCLKKKKNLNPHKL